MSTAKQRRVKFDVTDGKFKPHWVDGQELPDWKNGPDMVDYVRALLNRGWTFTRMEGGEHIFER